VQVVHTHVPLSPSSIIWYRPKGGDAAAGKVTVFLASQTQWSIHLYGLNGLDMEMSTPPTLRRGTSRFTFTFTFTKRLQPFSRSRGTSFYNRFQ